MELKLLKGDLYTLKEVIANELSNTLFTNSDGAESFHVAHCDDGYGYCLKRNTESSYVDYTRDLVSEAIDKAVSKVLMGEL